MNCQWDTCTYCGTTTGKIDCSKQITEYSNPTDCHPVASISHGNGLSKFNGNLNLQQQFKQQPGAPQSTSRLSSAPSASGASVLASKIMSQGMV